jgi:hypothetical protein
VSMRSTRQIGQRGTARCAHLPHLVLDLGFVMVVWAALGVGFPLATTELRHPLPVTLVGLMAVGMGVHLTYARWATVRRRVGHR